MGKDPTAGKREALVEEAELQTKAIMRLEVWQRLSYSMLAVGVLLGWWGFQSGGPDWSRLVGIVLTIVFAIVSAVFYTGVKHAKTNVKHILAAAGVDIDAKPSDSKEGDPKPPGEGEPSK